jgi:hypothetical protein
MSTTESLLDQSRPAVAAAAGQPHFWKGIGAIYCRVFHRAISRPVHGRYRCWKCLREFELEW